MKYRLLTFLTLAAALCNVACNNKNDPTPPQVFTSGLAIYYADYYKDKGVEAHVWEMEFYSGSVQPADGGYTGTGQILTFTDVFSPAPTAEAPLPFGTYQLSDTHEQFTAIPGMQQDGYDLGAYVTTMVDGQISAVEYFTAGSLDIQPAPDDSTDIHFDFQRRSGTLYHNTFRAPLPLYTAVTE